MAFSIQVLGGAILLWQAFLKEAVWEGEEEEEEASYDKDGACCAHAGHGPGQLMVERYGVVAGKQGQYGLVEHQDGEKHQNTCRDGGRSPREGEIGGNHCQCSQPCI